MRSYLIVEQDGHFERGVVDYDPSPTSPDDVTIEVEYSAVNFKDALVARPKSNVRRVARLVGGVDAAGVVTASTDPSLKVGMRVAVHGGELGVRRDGGFAPLLFAPSSLVNVLPQGLSTRDAMVLGTAGVTAMASILALEHHGLAAGSEVLVTGATGGVGSTTVSLLRARGYYPVASTGSVHQAAWLRDLGASEVIGRDEIADRPDRVLASERWAGAVDCVGGDTLHQILRSLRYGAAVAASGLVASAELHTNVYAFITRSVALLGIDTVEMSQDLRRRVWQELGEAALRLDFNQLIDSTSDLAGLDFALDTIANGATRGRILVVPT